MHLRITVLFPLLVRRLYQKSYLDSKFFVTVLLQHELNLSRLSVVSRLHWSGRQNLKQNLMSYAYPKKTNKIENPFILMSWINLLLDTIWWNIKRQWLDCPCTCGIFSSERSGLSCEATCPYVTLKLCFERHHNSLHEKLPTVLNSFFNIHVTSSGRRERFH